MATKQPTEGSSSLKHEDARIRRWVAERAGPSLYIWKSLSRSDKEKL